VISFSVLSPLATLSTERRAMNRTVTVETLRELLKAGDVGGAAARIVEHVAACNRDAETAGVEIQKLSPAEAGVLVKFIRARRPGTDVAPNV
jgi:hypothetical protein